MSDVDAEGWIKVPYRHHSKKVPFERDKMTVGVSSPTTRGPVSQPRKLRVPKKPIMSYGIILFTMIHGSPYFLLAQRRDTIEYVDFIRGHYTQNLLPTFFERMSHAERHRLRNYSFSDLWEDLWVNKDHQIYRYAFEKARSKYERVKPELLRMLGDTKPIVEAPPWGFPKGKKVARETPIQCAFREFQEETKMEISEIDHEILNAKPIADIYFGSNGKLYGTLYYVVYILGGISPIEKMATKGIRLTTISDEVGELKWATEEGAKKILNSERKIVLDCAIKIIRKNGIFKL